MIVAGSRQETHAAVKYGALSDVRVGKTKGAIDGDSRGRWGALFGETQERTSHNHQFVPRECCFPRLETFTTLTESVTSGSQSEPFRAQSVFHQPLAGLTGDSPSTRHGNLGR